MPAPVKKTSPQVSDEALEMIASWFRVLSEPSRLRILRALEGAEMNITDLVAATGLTQANVSRHVQSLAEAGMVARRKEGLVTQCRIADPAINDLCDQVCANLQKRLASRARLLS
ncbi:MAG: helix-turn-helix transcriptional regulator [Verrucomicrobiales bacterium]|nr:helix-turn-helix transcriptional regulator [Verrucomicrobiales bacterium]